MSEDSSSLRPLISRWRDNPNGTYCSWFLWEQRLKNFRSIRRGIAVVIEEIAAGTFGNVYKGSSLETVIGSISEQRQIFKGADHAFLWKPKLRIPDIYENPDNQRAFGTFLSECSCCASAESLVDAIHRLDEKRIKGLGPAAANVLYFLHPTHMPPFNTAIVKGFNTLTGSRVKLGKWEEYLALRSGMLRINDEHRGLLSNDLGAVGGLLFDIGTGLYLAPANGRDSEARAAWEADLERVRADTVRRRKSELEANDSDRTHSQIQSWLRDLGLALGFRVWIASNDRARVCGTGRLGDGCLVELPSEIAESAGGDSIRLIDVLWLDKSAPRVSAAFEVEHTTSIYSGIVRLLDLALGVPGSATRGLYLVAPDERVSEVRAQLTRPAFRHIADLNVRYLAYSELASHREAIARFGEGLKAIEAIARSLS